MDLTSVGLLLWLFVVSVWSCLSRLWFCGLLTLPDVIVRLFGLDLLFWCFVVGFGGDFCESAVAWVWHGAIFLVCVVVFRGLCVRVAVWVV